MVLPPVPVNYLTGLCISPLIFQWGNSPSPSELLCRINRIWNPMECEVCECISIPLDREWEQFREWVSGHGTRKDSYVLDMCLRCLWDLDWEAESLEWQNDKYNLKISQRLKFPLVSFSSFPCYLWVSLDISSSVRS